MKIKNFSRAGTYFLFIAFFLSQSTYPLLLQAEVVGDTASSSPHVIESSVPEIIASTTTSINVSTGTQPDVLASTTSPLDSTSTSSTSVLNIASSTFTGQTLSGFEKTQIIATSTDVASTTLAFASSTLSLASTSPVSIFTNTSNPSEGSTTSLNNIATTSDATSTALVYPTILSGSAVAMANVFNILNSNFINSIGSIIFSNFIDQVTSVDLRNSSSTSFNCGTALCGGNQPINWNLSDTGIATNTIQVDAGSGNNTISQIKDGVIATGNAYAGVNLVNLVNTTFADSHYLIATLNAFKGVSGDIIFPNFTSNSSETASILTPNSGDSQTVNTFQSSATIKNTASTFSDTGNNGIDASSSALMTGTGEAYTNIFNQVNSLLPGNGMTVLLRLSGKWNGQIFNPPAGMQLIHGVDGSLYLYGVNTHLPNVLSSSSIIDTSTSTINNNVKVTAVTGRNQIIGAQTALISTGNAYAGANIVNIANQHVVGKNWLLAVINIFGDFNGNISFGRPDLWIGDKVTGPAYIADGSILTYNLTIINNGDADASEVFLSEMPDTQHINISTSSLPYKTTSDGHLRWNIGNLPKGKAVEITYSGTVKNAPSGTHIINNTQVTEHETDNNTTDNTDSASIQSTILTQNGGIYVYTPSQQTNAPLNKLAEVPLPVNQFPIIRVTRVIPHALISESNSTTTEQLVIKNESNVDAPNVRLVDILKNSTGNIFHQEDWNLDTVRAHEEITVEYSFVFSTSTPAGIYTLSSFVEGENIASRTTQNGEIVIKFPEIIPSIVDTPISITENFTVPHIVFPSIVYKPTQVVSIKPISKVDPFENATSSTTFVPHIPPTIGSTENLLANTSTSSGSIPFSMSILGFLSLLATGVYTSKISFIKKPF